MVVNDKDVLLDLRIVNNDLTSKYKIIIHNFPYAIQTHPKYMVLIGE